ncbi:MAG: IS982 family transposase [Desulfobacteraceae bacterium]|nr:IS982 family transposase [Desulfobacteraceae bacterium]
MINDFDDFCTWMYVVVDDIWQQIEPLFKRPGPQPECSDSELITLTLVGECRGWDVETEMLSHWREHRKLFPVIPSQSRFNRRRRHLMYSFNLIRRVVLSYLDIAQDRQGVIDSLPIPVVQFHLVPSSAGDWAAYGATFGKVSSKKQTIFGYKLHLLVTLGGLILDFELAPANATDLQVGFELLTEHTDLHVLGDKGYISADKAAELWRHNRIHLQTLPRRNQKEQLSREAKRVINAVRQIIETVNGQLVEQFNIEINHAHTFWGLCTRLYSKLTAHTLCIYLNRLLGNPDFLQIKALAFPI